MLDLNFVRENLPLVEEKLRQRGMDPAACSEISAKSIPSDDMRSPPLKPRKLSETRPRKKLRS